MNLTEAKRAAGTSSVTDTAGRRPMLAVGPLRALSHYRNNSRVIAGSLVLMLIALVAVLAPVLAPRDPIATDLYARLQPPGPGHWLGTDQYGRDVLSRLIWGAHVSLQVAVASVALSIVVGMTLGALAGFLHRAVDLILMFVIDIVLAFPAFVFALALVASWGPGLQNVVLAIAVALMPRVALVTRAMVKTIAVRPYIEASRSVGCTDQRLIIRHVLPNTFPPILVLSAVGAGVAILAEAGLSFLGIGIPPPSPTWGGVVADGRPFLQSHPHVSIFGGLCIAVAVFAVNVLGDGLRDTLDPQLRGQIRTGRF